MKNLSMLLTRFNKFMVISGYTIKQRKLDYGNFTRWIFPLTGSNSNVEMGQVKIVILESYKNYIEEGIESVHAVRILLPWVAK